MSRNASLYSSPGYGVNNNTFTQTEDPYFNSTVLLLQGDNGFHGGNNKTITDYSSNNLPVTVVGNVAQGNFSPFIPEGYWSLYFASSGNYLNYGSNALFDPGTTGAWTWEAWIYPINNATFYAVGNGGTFGNNFSIGYNGQFSFSQGNGSSGVAYSITTHKSYSSKNWYHVTVCKDSSNNIRLFINGEQDGATVTSATGTIATASTTIVNGVFDNRGMGVDGGSFYISNLRWLKGTALYTSNFTVLNSPLQSPIKTTPIQSLSASTLLIARNYNNRDYSNNSFTNSATGIVSTTTFTPYGKAYPTTDSNSFGSSVFFPTDVTGNALTMSPGNLFAYGIGSFTIECWIYVTKFNVSDSSAIFSQTIGGTNYFLITVGPNGQIALTTTAGAITSPTNLIRLNTWNHVAVVRTGTGTNQTALYANGTLVATGTTGDLSNTTYVPTIGNYSHVYTTLPFYGYISNFRLVKGTALYTSNFTPPAAPLIPIQNTVLLLPFDTDAIVDTTRNCNIIPSNSVYLDNKKSPYGNGSLYFDGISGFAYTSLSASDYAFLHTASTKWTAEFWIYNNSPGTQKCLLDTASGSNANIGITLFKTVNETVTLQICYGSSGNFIINSTSLSSLPANAWTNLVVTYDHSLTTNNVNFYFNGINGGTGNKTGNTPSALNPINTLNIGCSGLGAGSFFGGYIGLFKLTRDITNYTQSFSPSQSTPNPYKLNYNDPYWNNVSLSLNADGLSGNQNSNIIDSSPNNFTISRFGTTYQCSVSPYSKVNYSGLFTNSAVLSCPDSSVFNLGTNDFTIECWFYVTSWIGSDLVVASKYLSGAGNDSISQFQLALLNTQNQIGIILCSGASQANYTFTGSTISAGRWYHLAAVRYSNQINVYLNGLQFGASLSYSNSINQGTSNPLFVGGRWVGGTYNVDLYFNGYISNFRYVNGVAVYKNNFIPPNEQLKQIPGTSLLALQYNDLLDRSINNHRLSLINGATLRKIAPILKIPNYNNINFDIGGSIFLDGNSYLTVSDNTSLRFESQEFTIECWIYPIVNGSFRGIFAKRNNAATDFKHIQLLNDNGILKLYASSTGSSWDIAVNGPQLPLSAWSHIAVSRSNITQNISLYLNGSFSVSGAITPSTSLFSDSNPFIIGAGDVSTTYASNCYISNFRIIKGISLYNSNFIPPTQPLKALDLYADPFFNNVELLLHCDGSNAGTTFIDNSTKKRQIIVNSTAQTSTTQYKFGSSSLYCGATSPTGYLSLSSNPDVSVNDYTVEGWFYFTTNSIGYQPLIHRNDTSADQRASFTLAIETTNVISFYCTTTSGTWTTSIISTTVPSINTWHHIAVTRSGTTVTLWFNGASIGTGTATGTQYNTNQIWNIGRYANFPSGARTFTGYIDEVRITLGVARYTTAFTPPTAAFPDYATSILLNGNESTAVDYSQNNNIVLSGAILDNVSKNGSSSIKFDGLTNYIPFQNNNSWVFGTNDFTVECWLNVNRLSSLSLQGIFDARNVSNGAFPCLYLNGSNLSYYVSGGDRLVTQPLLTGTWYHVALSRYRSNTQLFLNGFPLVSSYTDTTSYSASNTPMIGKLINNFPLSGNINGFKITNGSARYIKKFNPPKYRNVDMVNQMYNDPYINQTTFLLKTTNLSGGNNSVFLDSSTNNFPVTTFGNVNQSSITPFIPTGYWSVYFDGNSYLSVSSNSAFNIGTNSASVEVWCYSLSAHDCTINGQNAGSTATIRIQQYSGFYTYCIFDDTFRVTNIPIKTHEWVHLLVTLSGGVSRMFVNGTLALQVSGFGSIPSHSENYLLASDDPLGFYYIGYMSNFRFVNGAIPPEYVTTITTTGTQVFNPSMAPLSAISGTALLLCQNNRFVDNSTNNFSVSANNRLSINRLNPYNLKYDKYLYGGSMYFNGTTDYLTIPDNASLELSGQNFTIEFWLNSTTTAQYTTVIAREPTTWGTGQWAIHTNVNAASSGNVGFWAFDFNSGTPVCQSTGFSVIDNAWHHIAVVRNGSSFAIYIDGFNRTSGTPTWAGTIADISGAIYVGRSQNNGRYMAGYVSNLRILKGTALYTSNFTPSAYPLQAITNTSLLLKGTNNNVYDATGLNYITTISSSNVSTTVNVLSSSTLKLNGTSDYLITSDFLPKLNSDFTVEFWAYKNSSWLHPDPYFNNVSLLLHFNNNLTDNSLAGVTFTTSGLASSSPTQSRFGGFSLATTGASNGVTYTTSTNTTSMAFSADFTIEAFVYPTAFSGNIIDTRKTVAGGYRQQVGIDGSGKLVYIPYLNAVAVTTVTSNLGVTLNTWNHVAWCRSGGTTRMFINGVLDSVTYADTFSYTSEGITIGATGYTLGYGNFPGYIDEIRVTKDVARYTETFTVPITAFPDNTTTYNKYIIDSAALSGLQIYLNAPTRTLRLAAASGSTILDYTLNSLQLSTWYHIAYTRNLNTFNLYVNGISLSSVTISNINLSQVSSSAVYIGVNASQQTATCFDGYLADLRATTVCRYTSDFNIPTAPHPIE